MHKFSKTEIKFINYWFRQIQNDFPNFINHTVYYKDQFKYIEIQFQPKQINETNPWDSLFQVDSNFFRIFQIIVNKIRILYPHILIDIDYHNFSFKSISQQIYNILPKHQYILQFIDEYNMLSTNIIFDILTNTSLIQLNCEMICQPNITLINSRHKANSINQLLPLTLKYPLINLDILINHFIRHKYKKAG